MTKPTKWLLHRAQTRISLVTHLLRSDSLSSVWRIAGTLATQKAHCEDLSGWSESSLSAHAMLLVLSWLKWCAPNKHSDQPAQLLSLIRILTSLLSKTYSCRLIWIFAGCMSFCTFRTIKTKSIYFFFLKLHILIFLIFKTKLKTQTASVFKVVQACSLKQNFHKFLSKTIQFLTQFETSNEIMVLFVP